MSRLGKLNKRIKTLDMRTKPLKGTERIVGREHSNIRTRILIRDNFTCQSCKIQFTKQFLEVDHIIPLYAGGLESDSNRQLLCTECHNAKTLLEEGQRNG